MKLIDALKNVDQSENNKSWIEISEFAEALHIEYWGSSTPEFYADFENRIKAYWLMKWYCTDTVVGMRAVFFDGELIAMTWQTGRKSDQDVEFVSVEAAKKLREYILSSRPESEFTLFNHDEDIGETYSVNYTSEVMSDVGSVGGKPVTYVRYPNKRKDPNDFESWSKMTVRDAEGNELEIETNRFEIPLYVKKDK
jgi:hypothetical protein